MVKLVYMVTHVYFCPLCQKPLCQKSERVVKRGSNRNGTQRLQCQVCGVSWTPEGKSRTLSEEKAALIEKALGERLSQRAIARTLGVSRDTVRAVLKKSLTRHG